MSCSLLSQQPLFFQVDCLFCHFLISYMAKTFTIKTQNTITYFIFSHEVLIFIWRIGSHLRKKQPSLTYSFWLSKAVLLLPFNFSCPCFCWKYIFKGNCFFHIQGKSCLGSIFVQYDLVYYISHLFCCWFLLPSVLWLTSLVWTIILK